MTLAAKMNFVACCALTVLGRTNYTWPKDWGSKEISRPLWAWIGNSPRFHASRSSRIFSNLAGFALLCFHQLTWVGPDFWDMYARLSALPTGGPEVASKDKGQQLFGNSKHSVLEETRSSITSLENWISFDIPRKKWSNIHYSAPTPWTALFGCWGNYLWYN